MSVDRAFQEPTEGGDMEAAEADGTAIAAAEDARHTPAAAHVASLAPAARASVAASLDRAARLAAGTEHAGGLAYPWHRRPPATLAALRATLADRYAVATANASVNAVRGALRAAWLSGDMDRAMLERSLAALKQVRGKAAPGRALSPAEVRKLFEAAAADRNRAGGARDAALLALAYGAGLRRAELAAARLAGLDGDALRVHGKGRRERIAYLGADGCAAAVSAWLAVRGTEDGPLLRAVNKGGKVLAGGMSPRAIGKRVQVLGARAGLGKVSPHMLRRSFATSLLSAGNDLAVTADLMGHARTDTTRLYDRRGESAKRAAASTISVPYVRPGARSARYAATVSGSVGMAVKPSRSAHT